MSSPIIPNNLPFPPALSTFTPFIPPITIPGKSDDNVFDWYTIPPFKSDKPMQKVQKKSSYQYQLSTWQSLRKSITGLIEEITATNLKDIIPELLEVNLIRGRGVFCSSVILSQMTSPALTEVFSALVAVVNSKYPEVGQIFFKRMVWHFKRAYQRNDKHQILAAVKFIAHLVNWEIAHETIVEEILNVFIGNPTDDSVKIAVCLVKECGSWLRDFSPRVYYDAFKRFDELLYKGETSKQVKLMIKGLYAIRKSKFQGYPPVRPELDLVEEEDWVMHSLSLNDDYDPEFGLDGFTVDPYFVMNEELYKEMKKFVMDEDTESDEDSDSDDESDEDNKESMQIKDKTDANVIDLQQTNSDTKRSHSAESDSANTDENAEKRRRN